MAFTRQHYRAIARILGEHGASPGMVRAFGELFAQDNVRFDGARFLTAVGEAFHNRRAS